MPIIKLRKSMPRKSEPCIRVTEVLVAEARLSSGSQDTLPSVIPSRHTTSCASLPYLLISVCAILTYLKERDLQIINSFKVPS